MKPFNGDFKTPVTTYASNGRTCEQSMTKSDAMTGHSTPPPTSDPLTTYYRKAVQSTLHQYFGRYLKHHITSCAKTADRLSSYTDESWEPPTWLDLTRYDELFESKLAGRVVTPHLIRLNTERADVWSLTLPFPSNSACELIWSV